MPACLLPLMLGLLLQAGPLEPPVAGRPPEFTGAVGRFTLSATIQPTEVLVEQPVLLTVRVVAETPPEAPPGKPRLEEDELFREAFFVETSDRATQQIDDRTWEFRYRLRPRRVTVKEIPEIFLVFFDPSFGQDARGYQKIYSDPIALKVLPLPDQTTFPGHDEWQGFSAEVLTFHGSDAPEQLLQRRQPWAPTRLHWLVLGLVPPVACICWWIGWRRRYPDAGQRTHQRRSRAARDALQSLTRAERLAEAEQVLPVLAGFTRFLQQRFDFPATVPTPAEVTTHLQHLGAPDALLTRVQAFLETCDALRFASLTRPPGFALVREARWLILALEAADWSLQVS